MTFFEELKDIIPLRVAKSLYNFDLHLSSQSNPSRGTKFQIKKTDKQVVIFLSALSPKEHRTLKKAIKKYFNEDELYLIERNKVPLLERLYQYNDSDDNQILAFFKPILSVADWEALRDSLFLRNEFKKHQNISGLKSDIFSRYGERGVTICNLCSAGYFEQTMIPLYNADQREFWKYYDCAIDRGITALFVNSNMTIEDIRSRIKWKMKSGKNYGLKDFHIHGIGKTNIQNIKKCIGQEKAKGTISFTDKNLFEDPHLGVIVVEIIF